MKKHLLLVLLAALLSSASLAPHLAAAAPPAMSATAKANIVSEVVRLMHENYIFPEAAVKMETVLRARQAEGAYARDLDPVAFADLLTSHLREASKDRHISVRHRAPGAAPNMPGQAGNPGNPINADFGFVKTERLPGNIAYIEIEGFNGSPGALVRATEVMSSIADADALIVDLRRNGGGSPVTVAHVSSYLFDDKPVHLNDLYYRVGNSTRSSWTNPKVEGKRFGGSKPVYVLTSAYTFSAAEEFSYNLQQLKRATIIGETTGGGANPGQAMQIGPEHFVFLPTGRAINPISKTNWEGVGVKPDVAVPRDRALGQAVKQARGGSDGPR